MQLDKNETVLVRDAIVEFWHSHIRHSKNDTMKEKYRCLKEDFKTAQQQGKKFTITLND